MKKKNIAHIGTCSAILALLFGAGALSLHTNAALRGDINEDGKINANDYIALRRALLAGESLPSKTADVNGDGKINAADYIALRMHLLGLRPITQPEERFVRTPISLGCKYTVSGTIGKNYQDTYDSELTDGSYAISATYFDTEYVGFQRDNSDAAITVDLGSTRDGINGFEFSFLSTNSAGIMPPASVSVSVSTDGKSWTSLGNMKLNTSPIMTADKATLDLNAAVAARYVKFSFTHRASWVFVDEVSVYATLPEGDVYTVTDGVRNAYGSGITEAEQNDALNSVKTTVPVSSELPLVPLTDGKSYKYTNASFPFSALTDKGKMLTDGNSGTTFRDSTWVAVDGSKETIITIDLGKTENDISAFSLSSCQRATSAVYLPTYVGFEVSTDGKNFAPVARLYSPTAHPDGIYTFSVENDYCVKARYVRFRVGASGGRYTMISEVNASAHREDKTDAPVYPEVKLDTTDTGAWENPTSSVTNLLRGRPVQIDAYVPSVLDPEVNTPVTSGILTDGKQASSNYCYDGTWFHFNGGTGRYLYFDMGHVSAMKYVSGGMLQKSSWGISVPREIKIYLSEDGINWYIAGKTGPKGTGDENRKTFRIDFDKTYKARFICFDIKVDTHVFIDELSAYGTKSTAGAVPLSSSGLEKFDKNGDVYDMKYQSQSEALLGGVGDIVLAYYNHSVLDENFFRPYVGYIKDGKAQDTMFDGFLFLPTPGEMIKGGRPDFTSVKEEWEDLENKLFIKGQNLDALNKAAGKVKNELGLKDYKYKFYISIAHPSMHVTDFGDINGDGKSESLRTVEARIEAVKWYVRRFYKMYDPADYPNLEFAGWYWFHESIDTFEGDPEVIKGTSDYLHTIGDQLFWIPYFCAEGYQTWKDVGFDVCCMQPNFAFDERVGIKRLETAADIIRMNNMCIEIEADYRALDNDVFFRKYLGYLAGGVEFGYMKDSLHMYYEAGGLFGSAANSTGKPRIIYDVTYQFIKKTLRSKPEAPAKKTVSCRKNTPATGRVISDGINTLLITKQPSHGTVTSNGDGTFTYYPNKGYTGEDSFSVAANDYIGTSDSTTITVKIG